MSEWDQNIFEELISDNQFMAWAKGEDSSNQEYWVLWKRITRNIRLNSGKQ